MDGYITNLRLKLVYVPATAAIHPTQGTSKHTMQRPPKRRMLRQVDSRACSLRRAFAVVFCALFWGTDKGMQPWTYPGYKLQDLPSIEDPQERPWLKISEMKVSAMVFFGQKHYVHRQRRSPSHSQRVNHLAGA